MVGGISQIKYEKKFVQNLNKWNNIGDFLGILHLIMVGETESQSPFLTSFDHQKIHGNFNKNTGVKLITVNWPNSSSGNYILHT